MAPCSFKAAIFSLLLLSSAAAGQGAFDEEAAFERSRCLRSISLLRFKQQDLIDSIDRYRSCLSSVQPISCEWDFQEIDAARKEVNDARGEAEGECLLTGILVPAIPAP